MRIRRAFRNRSSVIDAEITFKKTLTNRRYDGLGSIGGLLQPFPIHQPAQTVVAKGVLREPFLCSAL